jgi:NADH dehydrogenase/NADH:ubiquinone oxidoreductase subunit G
MSDIVFSIDGKEVKAKEGQTVLEVARENGISIPTLCWHELLEPFGACRLCIVEVESRGSSRLVVSCVYPAEKNISVKTRSEKVDRIRKMILELQLAHAPDAFILQDYAKEYGADRNRFEKEPSFCIHCGLCVRYCNEVKKANAVGFVDRGIRKEISFIPEIAAKECWGCKECFPLCPTEALQAAYVLVEALAFPPGDGDGSK